jgi:phosphocarrier protein
VIAETATVVNELGIHARAAAKFVHLAGRYESRIRVARGSREIDGKSILGILLLAAACGSRITISADGVDERDAVVALVALVESGFGDDGSGPDRPRAGGTGR